MAIAINNCRSIAFTYDGLGVVIGNTYEMPASNRENEMYSDSGSDLGLIILLEVSH